MLNMEIQCITKMLPNYKVHISMSVRLDNSSTWWTSSIDCYTTARARISTERLITGFP